MPTKKLTIECCESVMGTWHYHLRKVGSNHALCGDLTMYSPSPLELLGGLAAAMACTFVAQAASIFFVRRLLAR